ncbi:MAG: thioredoxin family protein, partial [Parvularculaceae bacterium]
LVSSAKGDGAAFLTGVLAVFVAAPCVGPFLTAPIGAAAVLPPAAGMAIFLTMALGLAAPYVALSFSPALARRLPKPGLWMDRFRQGLAFPVFAAAAYFLWVLSAQTGGAGLALALGGLVLLGLATRLWEWGRTAGWARVASGIALVAALAPAVMLRPATAVSAASGYAGAETIAFDAADIDARRASGEPIFIDFTAAWCVTCQVNKATIFSSKRVAAAFAGAGVTFVVADWTNRDEAIEQALAAFGANGVPLYVFYPNGGEAVILPQPLTEAAILALFDPQQTGA